jgi:hypothetical protein
VGEQGEFEGMPQPWVPRVVRAGGRTRILHGSYVMFDFRDDDLALRNVALVALVDSGICAVERAGALFGLSTRSVERLLAAYRAGGPAGLEPRRGPGRPRALSDAQLTEARGWAADGVTHRVIGQRLGVARSVVSESLARASPPTAGPTSAELFTGDPDEPAGDGLADDGLDDDGGEPGGPDSPGGPGGGSTRPGPGGGHGGPATTATDPATSTARSTATGSGPASSVRSFARAMIRTGRSERR